MDIPFVLARYRRHHHYQHKTAAGNIMFWSGALLVAVSAYMLKARKDPESNQNLKKILSAIGFALVLLSYVVDLLIS